MCGRYTLGNPAPALAQLEIKFPGPLPERFNIAPTQPVIAVRERSAANREAAVMQWGLVPSWAKDPSIGSRFINARGEDCGGEAGLPRGLQAAALASCLRTASMNGEKKAQCASPTTST